MENNNIPKKPKSKKKMMALAITAAIITIGVTALVICIYEEMNCPYHNIPETSRHDYTGGGVYETYKKPVIYLYPEEDNTSIDVKLTFDGELTAIYPELSSKNDKSNIWNVVADKDGTIHYNNGTYDYLFWEGTSNKDLKIDTGYCIAKEDTVKFLEDKLSSFGLNDSEKEDFITYWLPNLNKNNYNVITFDLKYFNEIESLETVPAADTLIRVFMTFRESENPVEIEAPDQEVSINRTGFTVVEWGGTELK